SGFEDLLKEADQAVGAFLAIRDIAQGLFNLTGRANEDLVPIEEALLQVSESSVGLRPRRSFATNGIQELFEDGARLGLHGLVTLFKRCENLAQDALLIGRRWHAGSPPLCDSWCWNLQSGLGGPAPTAVAAATKNQKRLGIQFLVRHSVSGLSLGLGA